MKNPVFVIFNILSFCLAYLLSSYFFSTDKQYSISTSKNQNQKNEIILEQRRKQSLNKLAKKKHSKKRENSPGNLDISSFINLNSSGYKLYGQLSALQEARDLLKYFNEPQIINALNELEKNNKDNFSLRILLYKRWTELNPEASVLHIHKTQTGRLDDLLNRCLHQWVKVDHIGVLDLFKKNEKIKTVAFT